MIVAQAAPAPPSAPIVAPASPAAATPILGRHYRLETEEIQGTSTRRWRFVQTIELVFHRDGPGFLVEMTLIDLHAEPADATAARFMVGQGAMRGLTVRIRLDAARRLVAIDDEDRVWSQLVAGIDAMADRSPTQTLALARDPAAPLRALAPEARRRMIAADCLTVLPPLLTAGVHAVRLPGDAPETVALPGTETVTVVDGVIRDETKAYGGTADQGQSIERVRRIDATTGLLIVSAETRTIRIGDRLATVERRARLSLVP